MLTVHVTHLHGSPICADPSVFATKLTNDDMGDLGAIVAPGFSGFSLKRCTFHEQKTGVTPDSSPSPVQLTTHPPTLCTDPVTAAWCQVSSISEESKVKRGGFRNFDKDPRCFDCRDGAQWFRLSALFR